MSNHVILSDKTFYMPIEVLNAINNGTLINETTELPFRNQVKSITVKFEQQDVSFLMDANQNSVEFLVNSVSSYVELLDGTKYSFVTGYNSNFVEFVDNGSTLQLNFPTDYDGVTVGEPSFELTNYEFGMTIFTDNTVRISPSGVLLALNGFSDINGNNYIEVTNTLGNTISLSQTPVTWSNGGPSTPGLALYDGKVVGTVTDNPTQVEVTFNGQPLPTGSVVKFNGQKFLKVSGGSMEFLAIEIAPKAEWGWALSANIDWSTLQGY